MAVITSIALVLKELDAQIKATDSTLKTAYDPNLSYETGMNSLRANSNFNNDLTNQGEYPLFVFNRSIIRLSGDRVNDVYDAIDNTNNVLGTDTVHKVTHAEFDYRFLYTSPNILQTEAFEMNYMMNQGIKSIVKITPDLSALGLTKNIGYDILWNPLEDFIVESEGNTYKAIMGSARISGFFVTSEGAGKLTLTTYLKFYEDWYQSILSSYILT